jgi:hypothetical protein
MKTSTMILLGVVAATALAALAKPSLLKRFTIGWAPATKGRPALPVVALPPDLRGMIRA